MKLTREQMDYINQRRDWMDQREKDIRSFDNIYDSADLTRDLIQIHNERTFFNYMFRLHNVAVKAEKKAS